MKVFKEAGGDMRRRAGLIVLAAATLMTGCATTSSDLVPDEKTMGMSVTAVSHYGRIIGIPEYYVGKFYGGNSSGWGGGGKSSCCVLIPATITKPVMVKVRWKTYRFDVDEERWHEVTVPVNFAVDPGDSSGLYVHFLPGHKVEIWVSRPYPWGSAYPGPPFPRGPAPTYIPQPGETPSKLPLPPESN
jgi:hypothetical protein